MQTPSKSAQRRELLKCLNEGNLEKVTEIIRERHIDEHIDRAGLLHKPESPHGPKTLLYYAAENCTLGVVKLLVETFHANVNLRIRDAHGRTPLMAAVISQRQETVKYLVETAGADTAMTDKPGKTALDHADSHRGDAIRRMLRETESEKPSRSTWKPSKKDKKRFSAYTPNNVNVEARIYKFGNGSSTPRRSRRGSFSAGDGSRPEIDAYMKTLNRTRSNTRQIRSVEEKLPESQQPHEDYETLKKRNAELVAKIESITAERDRLRVQTKHQYAELEGAKGTIQQLKEQMEFLERQNEELRNRQFDNKEPEQVIGQLISVEGVAIATDAQKFDQWYRSRLRRACWEEYLRKICEVKLNDINFWLNLSQFQETIQSFAPELTAERILFRDVGVARDQRLKKLVEKLSKVPDKWEIKKWLKWDVNLGDEDAEECGELLADQGFENCDDLAECEELSVKLLKDIGIESDGVVYRILVGVAGLRERRDYGVLDEL